jgi:hypothetical protein
MNERIKLLAEQAGLKQRIWNSLGKELPMWQEDPDNPGLEKFAELIVKECLDIVNRKEYSYHEADPLWETSQLIKEHFGVEE